ncbi:uncharacterized protein LOC107479944 [Arachis duranensis]|uniref:Uncharacterized protein LOC107479944 n=1 Tax=Arachis duranensis TaxID=130453 RepID=A0A6P4CQD0_ARADU|nr:uncharacterized protein LOC107479944 [Arachis duranensis]
MGQDLELDISEKYSVGLSPNTVLPSSNAKRSRKGKPSGKDGFITLKGDFADIKLAHFRSASCKSHFSSTHGLEGNIEMRRGSMYQSSEERKAVRKMGMEGRKKIEISRRSDISFSGSILDSLCGSDAEDSEPRTSEISPDSNLGSLSVSRSLAYMEPKSSKDFIEICMSSDVKHGRGFTNLRSDKIADSLIHGNSHLEKDTVHSLKKSVSAKVEVSHLLLSPSESDCSSSASSKVELNPLRKRMNQFTKSKSLRSPTSHKVETNEARSNETANITRSRTYQKSLLSDLSNTGKQSDIISEFISREIQYSGIASSPVHLHGNLRIENKHGVPFLEFKVRCPEDVFVAKAWRTRHAFNWVYTFHSIDNRKKSSASATGSESHEFDKDCSMVAQMVVSSNLGSEQESQVSDNSMVTEFVLYDFTHSRPSVSHETKSFCEQDASERRKASKEETLRLDEENLASKNKRQYKPLSTGVKLDYTDSYHLLSTRSYSNVESAAIVLEIPFSRRESLKYRRGDRISAKEYSSIRDQSRNSLNERKFQEQLKVVIPTGNHGLPDTESQGPSSLLDRLRHGGGCDCGGWDMACPLILLGNPSIQFSEDCPLMEEYQALELFIQGAKECSPTFSMRRIEEGQYAVDFHVQLSTLQAFSISVAILHGSSNFSEARQNKPQQLSQCSSLKMLIEEDVEFYIKSVTKEESRKTVSKTRKGIPRPYALNPPFSPIARV